ISQQQLDDDADAYAEQFSDTTINQNGTSWNVTYATYNGTSVNLTVTFPNLSTGTSTTLTKLDVTISGDATSQDGKTKLTLTEGALSITPSTPLPLQVQDGIWEYTGDGFVIADASLKASATLENTDAENVKRTFTGGFELAAGTPAAQQTRNPRNPAAFLLKKIALNGTFTASNVTGGKLEAKLTATMDNYDTYTSLVDGTAVNVPAAFTLYEDAQTLSVTLGTGDTQQSFDMKHYVGVHVSEQYQTEEICETDEWSTEPRCYTRTNTEEICGTYSDGTPYCHNIPVIKTPAVIDTTQANSEDAMSYYRMENCNVSDAPQYSMFTYHCGEDAPYMPVWPNEPVDNILQSLPVHELYWTLEDFRLQDATFGSVIFPDNWEDKYEQLSESNRTVTFNAVLDNNAGYEDTEANHILATITAELTGKLSANLPAADVKLQLQRTGFQAGKADLTLGWTENGSSRKFLQLSAQGAGNTDAELEQNLRVTLSDAAGTTVRLLLADDSTGTNV